MGPYCNFCDMRCFVPRILRDGRSMILATCTAGMRHDHEATGEDHTTALNPATTAIERYCVESGRAVRMIAGDRCLDHGAADTPCRTAVREAQCAHEHLSPNHSYPHCSECGRDLPAVSSVPATHP